MPALPLDEAGKYVAGAYVFFVVLLLIYVAIMAARLSRIDREIEEISDSVEGRSGIDRPGGVDADPEQMRDTFSASRHGVSRSGVGRASEEGPDG